MNSNTTSLGLPYLSIIIVTKNNKRTLPRLLQNILEQDYPKNKIETIIIDGKSTDGTIEIIKNSGLKVKLVTGQIPNDPEACKGEGLQMAKGEIVALIDSDNYFPHKKWLRKMVEPLFQDKSLVGSYPWRFAYNRNDNLFNRYFSLIGSADPVGLYLGKADKISYVSDDWILCGEVLENHKDYLVVQFDEYNFPTLGSNGFFARREYLLKGKSDIRHFFHIDVPYDILKFGLNKYAAVKDVVIHDTAVKLIPYVIKRSKYMELHYQARAKDRRYRVFDPDRKRDMISIILFVIFSLTIVQPLYVACKGYAAKRDFAWFIHPVFCFAIMLTYVFAVIKRYLNSHLRVATL